MIKDALSAEIASLASGGSLKGLVSEEEAVPVNREGRICFPVLPANKKAVGI